MLARRLEGDRTRSPLLLGFVDDRDKVATNRRSADDLVRSRHSLDHINQASGMIDYEILTGLSPRNERRII